MGHKKDKEDREDQERMAGGLGTWLKWGSTCLARKVQTLVPTAKGGGAGGREGEQVSVPGWLDK
jgi:hypothetical protein